jgi:hypothetical protein
VVKTGNILEKTGKNDDKTGKNKAKKMMILNFVG